MQQQDEQNEPTWGARVNSQMWGNPEDAPSWANPLQIEEWSKHGLVLWDHKSRQISRLSAATALELLDYLRTTQDWREHGFTVGQPATKLALNKPEREPEHVLLNRIHLTPDQLQQVLDLLLRKEPDLERLREDEAEDRKRRLSRVYTILLDLAARHDPENPPGITHEDK